MDLHQFRAFISELEKGAEILPEFISKARKGYIDPGDDDFAKNQAFGRAVGIGILPTLAGAGISILKPKYGVPVALAGMGAGALTYKNRLEKFRALQEQGLNPVTGKPLASKKATQGKDQEKQAEVDYHGKKFPGYNQPIPPDRPEKKMMVLAKKGDEVRLVHFGQKGYKHNYTPEAKKNYLTRSAGIRNKSGELTMNDKFSPNYWARRVLWPKGETGEGSSGPIKTKNIK